VAEAEEQEEDDKAAELEALLEQFREPEEEPRKRKTGPIWYFVALILAVAGCWMAVRATQGVLLDVTAMAAAPMKPTKVRDRSEYYAQRTVSDVQADYRERCKKGMTAKEVRWIVEDFIQIGLAEEPGGLPGEVRAAEELLQQTAGWKEWEGADGNTPTALAERISGVLKSKGLQLAGRQQRWYVDALADGLRLDRAQRKQAYANGRQFVEDLGADFPGSEETLKLTRIGDGDGEAAEGSEGVVVRSLLDEGGLLAPTQWLQDARCAPWELCDLRSDQRVIFNHTLRVEPVKADEAGGGAGSSWYDPERELVEAPADARSLGPVPSAALHHAVGVFPFMADQDRGIAEGDLTGLLKSLHPAQFKMLLLTEPGMAAVADLALTEKGE
jgi:hypothetical protein